MTKTERIHGFDALRTIAMWLGVLLHAVIAYKASPEPNWPYDTAINGRFLDWLYNYIHVFRMPLFFFVAGFFARMVISRSGSLYFIRQRFKRIVVPFVLGVIVIVPLTLFPFNFYKFCYTDHLPVNTALQNSAAQLWHWNGLAHLWFLYYLVIFYSITLAGRLLAVKRGLWQLSCKNISIIHLLAATIVLYLVLWSFGSSEPPVYTGIKPSLFYLAYYGFFYLAGWIVQVQSQAVRSLGRYCYGLLATGTAIAVYLFLQPGLRASWLLPLTALQTIAVTAGITGLFIKYFHNENRVWRYCSDAAYWVYLVHLPVVALCQVLLLSSPLPVPLRPAIVLVAGFGFSLLSYQVFVRYTIIGEYLHGKRNRPEKNNHPRRNMALR